MVGNHEEDDANVDESLEKDEILRIFNYTHVI
jgi:hypothetical protein